MSSLETNLDTSNFFEQLIARIVAIDSILCVGLDPHINELSEPTAACAADFCRRIIEATLPFAAAYKPNAAFFERFGSDGVAALQEVIKMIPEGVPCILDAKRGDIGSTSTAYAVACLDTLGASAVTLSPYMGSESLEPFTAHPHKGVFILCKTSNKSADQVQMLRTSPGGLCVFEEVAKLAASEWNGNSNVGLVVGATDVVAIERVRRVAPHLWILAPGIGAQGGELSDACRAGFMRMGESAGGILFPVSRGISKSEDGFAAAAERFRDRMNACRAAWVEKHTALTTPPPAEDAESGSSSSGATELAPYQQEFLDFAIQRKVLRFGSFTLKSGRQSPYFFNTGLFDTGATIAKLARFYAKAVRANGMEFDVIFGPAYKGIPLATAIAMALSDEYDMDCGVCYNRKEKKDHGEGGVLVGASMEGKRVLVVDDVITAGTAMREAVGMVSQAGGVIAGVLIALDRQEKVLESSTESAVQSVARSIGCPVHALVSLAHLSVYLKKQESDEESQGITAEVNAYRSKYGVC